MNTETLLQYNPKLADVSHTTRVAYAKFMTTKIKKEIKFVDEKERERGTLALNKFKANAGILKKTITINPENITIEEQVTPPSPTPAPSPIPPEENKDFRARTPIEEDPLEDLKSPTPTPSSDLIEQYSRKSSREDSPMPKQRSESIESAKNRRVSTPEPKIESDEDKEETPKSSKPLDNSATKAPEIVEIKEEQPLDTLKVNDDEIKEVSKTPQKSSSNNLSVPGASQTPSSPSMSISTGDKGKSKVSGKTLTGWL